MDWNKGLARSKELRVTMFTVPASAEAGDSGVGVLRTSIRERLLIETISAMTVRLVLPPSAEARLKLSIVTGT